MNEKQDLALNNQQGLILFTQPSALAGYDIRSIFKSEFSRFEFRVFPLLD